MFLWQHIKRLRIDSQQKKKYSYTLGVPLALELTDSAAQETYDQENQAFDSQAVSQSNNIINDELYQRWILLSPREQDVTALTCLKFTNPQIAVHLGLSIETVKTYIQKVLNKLDLQSKADLRVAFANWDFSAWERRKSHR